MSRQQKVTLARMHALPYRIVS